MKNRLVVAAKLEEKKQKDVSPQPKPNKKRKDSPTNKKTEVQEKVDIKTCAEAKRISELFSTQIETPIGLYMALDRAGNPQKCLIHDNASTLFCTVQRRPICAMCMYQNNTHKSHKVLPINKATQLLNSELQSALLFVKNQLDEASIQIALRDQKISQIQLDYPALMRELQTFYAGILAKLLEKQNQQLQFLSESYIQTKHTHTAISVQLKKINSYALERVKQLTTKKREQNIVYKYNVVTELRKLDLFFGQPPEEIVACRYFEDIKKFQQLDQLIGNILNFSKEGITQQLLLAANSKRSFRKSGQANPRVKKQKMDEEGGQVSPEEKQSADKHERKVRSPPRNRHSASQVKLKLELFDRKQKMQKKLLQKSTSLIRERSQSKPNLSTTALGVNPPPNKKSPHKLSIQT